MSMKIIRRISLRYESGIREYNITLNTCNIEATRKEIKQLVKCIDVYFDYDG